MNKLNSLNGLISFRYLVLISFSICFNLGISAQDIHYSQTGNSPLNLNPGLTGVFGGNHRFAANMRRQWDSVPVPYFQLAGSYDIRFVDEKERFKPWASGLVFNYDRAGDSKLSLTQLALSGSYSFRLSPAKKNFLTFGLMAGGIQRSFKTADLQFDDQYTLKEGFVSTTPTSEAFDQATKLMGDVSVGTNLHLRKGDTRATLDAGAAVFHLFEPKKNFHPESFPAHLETRYSLHALGTLPLASRFDLLLSATGQFQNGYSEGVLGAGGTYHFSTKKTQELDLMLGLYYRIDDAIIPTAGITYQDWRVQLSYDINTSAFKEASLKRGGPEISVIYILRHVPLMEFCKNCPTYM